MITASTQSTMTGTRVISRREFLTRGALALAGGLVLGDAAMEAFEALTHRKVFALGQMPNLMDVNFTTNFSWPGRDPAGLAQVPCTAERTSVEGVVRCPGSSDPA